MRNLRVLVAALAAAALLLACIGTNSDNSSSSSSTSSAPGQLKVTLTWPEDVDMDLEIWDGNGENLINRSYECIGQDSFESGNNEEYFVFQQYTVADQEGVVHDRNFGAGKYVVSVFFSDEGTTSELTQGNITLTLTKPDGSTSAVNKTIYRTDGQNQWHAYSIDASTGNTVTIDKFVDIVQQ